MHNDSLIATPHTSNQYLTLTPTTNYQFHWSVTNNSSGHRPRGDPGGHAPPPGPGLQLGDRGWILQVGDGGRIGGGGEVVSRFGANTW